MLTAPALRSAICYVTLLVVIFFEGASGVPSAAGQEIDPRDYIGEDISKYPPHLRNQIERAFLRETGERFTGSQYDPRSPNYAFDKKKSKRHGAVLGAYEPTDFDELMERMRRSRLQANPELRSSFDYAELEGKYPINSIRGRYQLEEKRRRENPFAEDELKYKEKLLEQKTVELELKKVTAELESYDNPNSKAEIQRQSNLAKSALERLDVGDPDFILKLADIQKKYPQAFKADPEIKSLVDALLKKRSQF